MVNKKDRIWSVYRHTSPSGKVYVGVTSNLKNRWGSNGRRYCTYHSIFKEAIRKYGWDNITHEIVLENVLKSEAVYAEKYLIKWYKINGLSYNITDGGEGTLGMKFSQERIENATNARLSNSSTSYLAIDKDFNYTEFITEKEAADFVGTTRATIATVLKHPGYTANGYYIWKHEKGTSVDIERIKNQILETLTQRHQILSNYAKSRINILKQTSREAMTRMTSEERKKKFSRSEQLRGRHHTEETKKKMSEAAKGRDMSKAIEASHNVPHVIPMKAVIQLDLNNNIINCFSSIKEAKHSLGKTSKSISNCLAGRAATAFGYRWKYKE